MSVDTEERPTNVKGLIIEPLAQKPEMLFEPENEFTEENWSQILRSLEAARLTEKVEDVIKIAGYSVLMVPQRRSQLDFLDDNKHDLIGHASSNGAPEIGFGGSGITNEIALLQVLYPENNISSQLGELWTPEQAIEYNRRRVGNSSVQIAESLFDFCLLYPSSIPDLTSLQWLRARFEHDINDVHPDRFRLRDPYNIARDAAVRKLLFPELISPLIADRWDEFKEIFAQARDEGRWENALKMATYLAIASSEKAEMTPHGLKITPLKPVFNNTNPPLPVGKKF